MATACLAQSSRDGSFSGRTFTDKHFHIAFDLPAILQSQPASSLNIHAPETPDGYIMAVGRKGTEPYGIVLIAQRLQPGPGKIHSAAEYLDRVKASRSPADVPGNRGHQVNASGLAVDWLDWKVPNTEFDSAVIVQRGDYLLVARCNAKSEADLQAMKAALFAMRTTAR